MACEVNDTTDPKEGECLCITRFSESDAYAYHNSIMRQISILERGYLGRLVAFCPTMQCVEGESRKRFGLGIIYFPNLKLAQDWYTSAREIRQHDWLSSADMFLVPARADFILSEPIIEIIEWTGFRDIDAFQRDYLSTLIDPETGGRHNVVAAPDYSFTKLRGLWNPRYLVVNQWASVQALKAFADDNGQQMVEFMSRVASGVIWAGINEK